MTQLVVHRKGVNGMYVFIPTIVLSYPFRRKIGSIVIGKCYCFIFKTTTTCYSNTKNNTDINA